ncbi:hypothetical protein ACVIWV_009329 [Bradyrhizobium diazoefficiens]
MSLVHAAAIEDTLRIEATLDAQCEVRNRPLQRIEHRNSFPRLRGRDDKGRIASRPPHGSAYNRRASVQASFVCINAEPHLPATPIV